MTLFMSRRLLTAAVVAAGVMLGSAPLALAGNPVPGPEPDPAPAPTESASDPSTSLCQDGEVMKDGNCVPNMGPVTSDEAGAQAETPLRVTDDQTTTLDSGMPANQVPNLNGTPCTGDWMSGACYAESQDPNASVEPRSTLSSSP